MASFLHDNYLNIAINNIIINSKRSLVLISPDLTMPDSMLTAIRDRADHGINVSLVYRLHQFTAKIYSLANQKNISVYINKDLNARCYGNESSILMASRSLEEGDNQLDMGVLLTSDEDATAFDGAASKIEQILKASHPLFCNSNRETDSQDVDISALASTLYYAPRSKDESPSADLYFSLSSDSVPSGMETARDEETEALISTEQLARQRQLDDEHLISRLVDNGLLIRQNAHLFMSSKAKRRGATSRVGNRGLYFLWPEDIHLV